MIQTFADVLDIKNGKNQKNVECADGRYPIYGSGGEIGRAKDYICRANTVVIGRKGNINKPLFVTEPFWNVDTAFGLEADIDKVLPLYLYYFCLHFDFERLNKAVTIPSLTKADLLKIQMEVPPQAAQCDVVERLRGVEQIIELRRQQLAALDTLIKARFVELFGEPIANPRGWPIKRLQDVSTLITNGTTPKGGSENYVESGIMFLRSQNVWRNRFEMEDVAYIDEATHESMKKSSVHHNDILITKTGRINTENSSLGRAALYKGADDSANINGHVYLVRLDGSVNPEFVVTILTGEAYRKYIRKVCVGGIDKRQINVDQVENFPIILPPLEQQNAFAAFVAEIDKSRLVVQKALDEAQLLFDSLMQQYFG